MPTSLASAGAAPSLIRLGQSAAAGPSRRGREDGLPEGRARTTLTVKMVPARQRREEEKRRLKMAFSLSLSLSLHNMSSRRRDDRRVRAAMK